MNVSGDALIVVTVMLLMHCSIGMCLSKIDENYQQQQRVHDRTKRFVFLKSSGIGYLVAIAIPTSAVNNQRVYMALNFEAHYGLADADTFLDKFNHKYVGDTSTDRKRDIRAIANNDRSNHFTEKNNVYTRKNLYRILRQHIESYGYNGTACLMRIICETSETPLYEYNGVFGNIFHILFSPSSSRAEKINPVYYDAELHGQQGDCQRYYENCPLSFLDMISDMISIGMRTIS